MRTILTAAAAAVALLAAWTIESAGVRAAGPYPDVEHGPRFTAGGDLVQPRGFRSWVFLGSPLTPDALNGGAAGFPEFHNVYVEPAALGHYREHGRWPQGTVLVKELQRTQPGESEDGSRVEASGRGYFPGAPNGLDVSVKDSQRFAETNGWGFFNFGHHAPPYAASAPVAPAASCAGCHQARAHEDMVFTGFYRLLEPLPLP